MRGYCVPRTRDRRAGVLDMLLSGRAGQQRDVVVRGNAVCGGVCLQLLLVLVLRLWAAFVEGPAISIHGTEVALDLSAILTRNHRVSWRRNLSPKPNNIQPLLTHLTKGGLLQAVSAILSLRADCTNIKQSVRCVCAHRTPSAGRDLAVSLWLD